MTAASPVMRDLELERFGLRWAHAPAVLAHPLPDAPAAVLSRDLDATIASIEPLRHRRRGGLPHDHRPVAPIRRRRRRSASDAVPTGACRRQAGVGRPGRRSARVGAHRTDVTAALRRGAVQRSHRFPALRRMRAARRSHAGEREQRVHRLAARLPRPGGRLPRASGRGRRAHACAGHSTRQHVEASVRCGSPVVRVVVRNNRAVGVSTADGDLVRGSPGRARRLRRRAPLHLDDRAASTCPPRLFDRLARFQRSSATFKVDWALSAPIPWSDPSVAAAGTVHIADDLDELATTAHQLRVGVVPDRPFLIARPDDDGRSDALTTGNRVGVGLRPRAAGDPSRCRRRRHHGTVGRPASRSSSPVVSNGGSRRSHLGSPS